MWKFDISVVVIGRNESERLPALCASLEVLKSFPYKIEFIYVDSASEDNSVEVARPFFDRVVLLQKDSRLNASAGRFIGSNLALGEWLLFLDGDMVLCPDFSKILVEHILLVRVGQKKLCGMVGAYVNYLDSGAIARWTPKSTLGPGVDHFGGAVLLPREFLAAENWNPRLFSNEEIDLLARLKAKKLFVIGSKEDFIEHHTEYYSPLTKFRDNLIPRGSSLGKKFYGIGQLLHMRIQEGGFLKLLAAFPEPFVVWGSLLILILLICLGKYWAGLCVFGVGFLFVLLRKPPTFYVLYLTFISQAFWGWARYIRDWEPIVENILESE